MLRLFFGKKQARSSSPVTSVDHHSPSSGEKNPTFLDSLPVIRAEESIAPTLLLSESASLTTDNDSLLSPSLTTASLVSNPPKETVVVTGTHILPLNLPTAIVVGTVVLIDPLSTGVHLQKRLFDRGYNVILVWSDRSQSAARQKHYERSGHGKPDFLAIIEHEGDESDTIDQILAVTSNICAVMCGSEYGVVLEDIIASALQKRLEGTNIQHSGIHDRQMKVDKHAQANAIRRAGLAAVRETLAYTEADVHRFLATSGTADSFVVKPQTGAGSVGVTMCHSHQDVWDAFYAISAGEHKANYKEKYQHYAQAGVLCQEYLKGTEYIVNSVVRKGEIKTTAVFKYGTCSWIVFIQDLTISVDKRPFNGAGFVCFSKELQVVGDEPQVEHVIDYAEQVLRAVGFQSGAIHAEIMYTEDRGPVLVELNCRLHGGNGAWVRPASLCMGYDQLTVFMDVYLNKGQDIWPTIPVRPVKAQAYCQQVKMRSVVAGTLDSVIPEQWQRITSLASYSEHVFGVRPGDRIMKTIDMPSVPGEVTLINENKATLARDYEELNTILRQGIFRVVE